MNKLTDDELLKKVHELGVWFTKVHMIAVNPEPNDDPEYNNIATKNQVWVVYLNDGSGRRICDCDCDNACDCAEYEKEEEFYEQLEMQESRRQASAGPTHVLPAAGVP
jgi:hypothetical protein